MPSNSALSPSHEIRLGGEATNYGISDDFDNEYENYSKSGVTETHKRSRSSDIQFLFDGANNISGNSLKDKIHQNNSSNQVTLSTSASSPAIAESNFSQSAAAQNTMNSNNNFFSLTEDDEDMNVSDDVNASSTPTKQSSENRPRHPSSAEASDLLFPIYEDPHITTRC